MLLRTETRPRMYVCTPNNFTVLGKRMRGVPPTAGCAKGECLPASYSTVFARLVFGEVIK